METESHFHCIHKQMRIQDFMGQIFVLSRNVILSDVWMSRNGISFAHLLHRIGIRSKPSYLQKETKMFTSRFFYLLMVVFNIVTACAPQVPATPEPTSAPMATLVQDEAITLRLAVADAEGRPSEPYVLAFIEQVETLSDGNITIQPIWEAGADITPVFEQGVVKVVMEGQYDLGLAASRAWDSIGVTSFQALQAPFLITDDALAEAVAASDIGTRMLDSLSSVGAVGLALWPEDLRHPFSVVPDKAILSPDDFEGATVRVVPSEVSHLLIETLGGSPMFGDGDYQAAESGLRQGFSLTGTPMATGNVIFFPKFQVLFANGPALEKLSEAQRSVLREVAAAIQQKAIAEHPSESDAAEAWCADGGTVVMASVEQVAAFETAAIPVFEKIEQDPLNEALITSIRELKAKTAPSAGASTCAPEVSKPNPEPTTETQVWSQGLPPDGTWQAERTIDDFVRTGMMRSVAESGYAGVYTITFKDGKYTMTFEGLRGLRGRCEADYVLVEEDIVRLTYDPNTCSQPPEDFQWRIDEEGLHLHHVASFNGGPPEVAWTPFYEATPWQQVANQ
jgi:TRAP-type C4-dicarboxylate transport system substrate-binding protein